MILFDGATGTYFEELTHLSLPPECANILYPETVSGIHKAYIEKGSNAIKTNTFSARDMNGYTREALIEAGYAIALEAANGKAEVFADIGGVNQDEDAEYTYLENTKVFVKLGAKNYLFETLSDLESVIPSIDHIAENTKEFRIFVSFAADADGYTKKGRYYKNLISEALSDERISAAGLNCVSGPVHIRNLLLKLPDRSRLIAMPNAGYPSYENGRLTYHTSYEYFAQRLLEMHSEGISILGGCCGTTPLHIEAFGKLSAPTAEKEALHTVSDTECEPNPIRDLFASDKPLLIAELDCPLEGNADKLNIMAKAYSDAGADIISLTDSPLARARGDSFVMASHLSSKVRSNLMPHLTCRDKNHIAARASVIAASMCGIRSVLAITGDSLPQGVDMRQRSETSNSYKLISQISEMNESVLNKRDMLISAALNVNAVNFDKELERALKKESLGAEMFVTQAIYTDEAIENLKLAKQSLNSPIIAGILPPASYKNAVFMNNEVKGITISREIVDALYGKTKEETLEISSDYSVCIMQKCAPYCKGFMLMTPLNKYDLILKVIEKAKSEGLLQ